MPLPDIDKTLVPLLPHVQNYAWGIVPAFDDSIVARMYAYATSSTIDALRPHAELWIGTHHSGPALLHSDPSITLQDFISKSAPHASLPYLLKILSVAKPLSIQAHPDKILAAKLHANNPTAYKDDNHKPEMCVALTDFEGMCNFQPVSEIITNLKKLQPLSELCGGEDVLKQLEGAIEGEKKRAALRTVFQNLMSASEESVTLALEKLLKERKTALDKDDADELFFRLVSYYPGDVGCFAAYLLNYIRIKPGQAFFMAANEPHAYLKGQCVEIMAKSDNVVRAGLTPKFKDVDTLVQMLTYQDGPPTIMNGDVVDTFATVYRPPAEEFELMKVRVPPGEQYEIAAVKGIVLIMVLGGMGWIGLKEKMDERELDTRMPLATGSVYYVAEGKTLLVQADRAVVDGDKSPDLFFFRASVNQG